MAESTKALKPRKAKTPKTEPEPEPKAKAKIKASKEPKAETPEPATYPVELVELAGLVIDEGIQLRAKGINKANLAKLQDVLRDNPEKDFRDPIVVFDDGKVRRVGDGFHRHQAGISVGRTHLRAEIRTGSRRDAIIYAAGCNALHGLGITRDDQAKAIGELLKDGNIRRFSDTRIAEICNCSPWLVKEIRAELEEKQEIPHEPEREWKDGRVMPAPPTRTPTTRARTEGGPPTDPDPHHEDASQDPDAGGHCKVNGQLVPDPPAIAAKRAQGKIPKDAIPEIEQPEDDAETEAPGSDLGDDALSDDEYLSKLPAYARLDGGPARLFRAEALYYRDMETQRKTFANAHSKAFARCKREGGGSGPYTFQVTRLLKAQHPKHWHVCPPTDQGGCGGTGSLELGTCNVCKGSGYLAR